MCVMLLAAACDATEPDAGGGGNTGPQCGVCLSSDACATGYFCDLEPCLVHCECGNPTCLAYCAGVCMPRTGPYCGDGTCASNENCDSCAPDCGACVCGNAACNANEDCDACPADCSCVSCASATDVAIGAQAAISISGAVDSIDGTCAPGPDPERVLRVTQGAAEGFVRVRVEASGFLLALSARRTCEDAATEIACVRQASLDDQVELQVFVPANAAHYFVIEGEAFLGGYDATISVSLGP